AIGPDLTGYERGSLDFWLSGILDPSLEIREGFETYIAKLSDGRILTGMMASQEPQTITLRDAANQTTVVSRAEIANLQAIPMSLMPEGLLGGLSDTQLADLFAYLSLAAN
ncbi:MAG: dehydrogenase, partial [Verrucomicrobiota bacterium]